LIDRHSSSDHSDNDHSYDNSGSSAGRYQGLALCCREWRVEPLVVQSVRSSFFESRKRFPPASVAFDNALLMRRVAHTWRGRGDLCCAP